jgi:hypothetical protein
VVGDEADLAVVDLDGVVADVRHRLAHIQRAPKDWSGFFAAAVHDPVLPEGRAVVEALVAEGKHVVWLTGRPERCRADTLDWLDRAGLPTGPLHMRGDDDRRPASLTKLAVLRRLAGTGTVAVVIDDDQDVVRTLRRAGFTVLHADWMSTQPALRDGQEAEGRT